MHKLYEVHTITHSSVGQAMSTKHEYGYTHAPCIVSALTVIKVECVAISSQNDCQGGSDIYNRTGPALYGYRITVSEPSGVS